MMGISMMRIRINRLVLAALVFIFTIQESFAQVVITITSPASGSVIKINTQISVVGTISWNPQSDLTPDSALVTILDGGKNITGSAGCTLGSGAPSIGYTSGQAQTPSMTTTGYIQVEAFHNGIQIGLIDPTYVFN